jgi:hypothetical protein
MYIPDGWKSTEQDAGEFNLQNPDFAEGSGLFFWRDVIPVEPDGTHITTVPSTVAGITDWLRADHQLVVTDPIEKVIGKGLATTTFVVEVAKGAVSSGQAKLQHIASRSPNASSTSVRGSYSTTTFAGSPTV